MMTIQFYNRSYSSSKHRKIKVLGVLHFMKDSGVNKTYKLFNYIFLHFGPNNVLTAANTNTFTGFLVCNF